MHFRMLTAACGQAALQHHRQLSLELVGAGACRQPAEAGRRERRPLQGLRNALGLIVGVDAHTPAVLPPHPQQKFFGLLPILRQQTFLFPPFVERFF